MTLSQHLMDEKGGGFVMGKYDDIIGRERPVSKRHTPMSLENRAAQFAPFAALTGYDDAVEETARYTDEKKELTYEKKQELEEALAELKNNLPCNNRAIVTYFVPDRLKAGGEYVSRQIEVRRIDEFRHSLVLMDKSEIMLDDILSITQEKELT